MNKFIATLLATGIVATAGLTAAQAKQDSHERAAFEQTIRNETFGPARVANPAPAPILEGRNAAVDSAAAANSSRAIQQAEQQER